MKKRTLIFILVLLFALALAISSCEKTPASNTTIEKTPPVVTDTLTFDPFTVEPWLTHGLEAPDDIVRWMFAIDYRANMQHNGTYPPPVIKSEGLKLKSGLTEISVGYRKTITSKAGEFRNNLFTVVSIQSASLNTGHVWGEDTLKLNVVGESSGIKFTQDGFFAHLLNYYKVLVVEIPATVKPGVYEFSIGIEFEGINVGIIPCTVEVIE
jgi:hypothetical protein